MANTETNWDDLPEGGDITEGEHLTRVTNVDTRETDDGWVQWKIEHTVIGEDDPCFGFSRNDWITFKKDDRRSMARCKLVLVRLGVKLSGKYDPKPEDILGCAAFTTWQMRKMPDGGGFLGVKFDGYRRAEGVEKTDGALDSDIPF